ncbi:(deoxy)nucleoside triphosphate pyrophosphohydrolase [Planctomyces sp. SH-PL62]|uniref:(deoxy)nucleoside triphosphate pyrophosphohydrolase n=1 Tax=Planctomyces sp. SH-PL62 TaxID=1636152 RepID=UPI00078CF144|nr:(deoxy)nucleoside triphosphate pyrophosphohydrolase [Planctomyces sp. SH-PL62]AMV40097.1 8-oxo-dGTP diphosphatase [Planctomyces sp. SH-PL62]
MTDPIATRTGTDADDGGKLTLVGIGIVRGGGRFLIRERPPGTVYAGYWEFPGGKVEPGETPEQTTVRECLEETGLVVVATSLRAVIEHVYPHGRVRLHFFDCAPADPSAQPDPEHGCRWVPADELSRYRFPEANEPILAQLVVEFGG